MDCGAEANLVGREWAQENGFIPQKKKNPYQMITVSGKAMGDGGMILYETGPLTLAIEGREMTVNFDIADIQYEAILGTPWLYEHNPDID